LGAAAPSKECYAFMRTTVDLPDSVYRSLKMQAGLRGVTLKQLLLGYVQRGLSEPATPRRGRQDESPVIIAPTGRVIRPLGARERRRLKEREDEARLG
jgi:hypothetical protein